MDHFEYQNLQNLSYQLITSQFFKKITQLLISISLFSFLCSYLSFYSFFTQFFRFYLLGFPLIQITSKNCVFLIFNGILVFLAKTSGPIHSLSGFDQTEPMFIDKITDGLQMETEKNEAILVDIDEDLLQVEEEVRRGEILCTEETESSNMMVKYEVKEEGENGCFVRGEEHEEEEKEVGFDTEEEELEKEKEIEKLSTEELNKMFDDFIRRMKEEIRIEATQHLIMA